jgi:hypothetical protein
LEEVLLGMASWRDNPFQVVAYIVLMPPSQIDGKDVLLLQQRPVHHPEDAESLRCDKGDRNLLPAGRFHQIPATTPAR